MGPIGIGVVVVAVLVVGVVLVRAMMGQGGVETVASSDPPPPKPMFASDDDDEEEEDGEVEIASGDSLVRVVVTQEGVAFVPTSRGLLLVPLMQSEERPDWLDRALDSSSVPYNVLNQLTFKGAGGGTERHAQGTELGAGDLTGARVVRGSGDEAWRLETLGRDGDFGYHPFSNRERAEEALRVLVDRGVVQRPLDEDGRSIPESPEDFEEARRLFEQTQSELAIDTDEEPREGEGPWVSDRR